MTSDEIIKVIKPNIMQHQNEGVWLLDRVRELNPKKILEIGCCGGGLTSALATTASIVTIDISKSGLYVWNMEKFLNICPNPKIDLVIGDSNLEETRDKVNDDYDVVVIDGGHDWKTGFKDWELYSSMSKVIAMHDIHEYDRKHGIADCGNAWNHFPTEFWWDIKNKDFLNEERMSNHKIKLDFEYRTEEFVDVISGGWGIVYKL